MLAHASPSYSEAEIGESRFEASLGKKKKKKKRLRPYLKEQIRHCGTIVVHAPNPSYVGGRGRRTAV
jgi:hypothetical protein